jgi:hypothetical protein
MARDRCVALAAEDEGLGVDQPSRLANGFAEIVVADDGNVLGWPLLVSQGFSSLVSGVMKTWVGAFARIAFTVRAVAGLCGHASPLMLCLTGVSGVYL